MGIINHPFVVDETPYCMWELSVEKRNEIFIKGIRPDYFNFLSNLYFEKYKSSKNEEEKLDSAMSLRIAYSHGLETIFSLIAATLQAPECIRDG